MGFCADSTRMYAWVERPLLGEELEQTDSRPDVFTLETLPDERCPRRAGSVLKGYIGPVLL